MSRSQNRERSIEQLNIPTDVSADVHAAYRTDDGETHIIFTDGQEETVDVPGSACTCGQHHPVVFARDSRTLDNKTITEETFVLTQGMGEEAIVRAMNGARCQHARLAQRFKQVGACPECDSHEHKTVKHRNSEGTILAEEVKCAACGTLLNGNHGRNNSTNANVSEFDIESPRQNSAEAQLTQ